MENIKLTRREREALQVTGNFFINPKSDWRVAPLLYVAGRFMAVHIDRCGKRKRAREQGRK